MRADVMITFDLKKYLNRWKGETVVCMASGPSMEKEDAEYCNGKARIITVNTTYNLAPWANVHYSSDDDWWKLHLPKMRTVCSGEFWTGHHEYISNDMHHCPYDKQIKGISNIPGVISWGGNSGFCAIGLAVQFGVSRIILLGFDMMNTKGNEHWHDDHDESIRKESNFKMWIPYFVRAYNDFKRLGIDVVNCSRETALPNYRRAEIAKVL